MEKGKWVFIVTVSDTVTGKTLMLKAFESEEESTQAFVDATLEYDIDVSGRYESAWGFSPSVEDYIRAYPEYGDWLIEGKGSPMPVKGAGNAPATTLPL